MPPEAAGSVRRLVHSRAGSRPLAFHTACPVKSRHYRPRKRRPSRFGLSSTPKTTNLLIQRYNPGNSFGRGTTLGASTALSWCAGFGSGRRLGERHLAHERWRRDADRLEDCAGAAAGLGTQDETLVGLIDADFLDPIEVADDVGPLEIEPGGGQTFVEFLAQHERQERTKQMSGNCSVGLVVDWPGLQDGFCCPENRFDSPQMTIGKGDRKHRQLAVGAQHVQAIEAGIFSHPHRVDLEMTLSRSGKETPVASVADEFLVAVLQLVAQTVDGGGASGRIALRLP